MPRARADGSAFVPPALATLVDEPPEGTVWLSEVKYDGYRLEALIDHGIARLLTRNGLDEAYAALQQESGSARPGLYRINLATGAATRVGTIGGGNRAITGLAIVPV